MDFQDMTKQYFGISDTRNELSLVPTLMTPAHLRLILERAASSKNEMRIPGTGDNWGQILMALDSHGATLSAR